MLMLRAPPEPEPGAPDRNDVAQQHKNENDPLSGESNQVFQLEADGEEFPDTQEALIESLMIHLS